jgi:hypothetical protein
MMKTTCKPPDSTALTDAALSCREPLWRRFLYMLLFLLIYSIVEWIAKATVLAQLVFRACSGRTQSHLLDFGATLSAYIHCIWRYLTFNDEQRPWPYSRWPKA